MKTWEPNGITHTTLPEKGSPIKKPDVVVFSTGGGGIGKIIMSTAVAKSLRQSYPNADLHVHTPHVAVYENIPWVNKVFRYGATTQYYEHYLKDQKIFWAQYEPYWHPEYINGTKHLIDAWCDGMKIINFGHQPYIQLTEKEKRAGQDFYLRQKNPCVAFQITGGAPIKKGQNRSKMFVRDLDPKIMTSVVNELKNTHGFLQIASEGQPLINGTSPFVGYGIREVFAIVYGAQIVLSIDSVTQHIAQALNKKCIVLWGATNPNKLGYESHVNLWREACPTPLCGRPNSYVMDSGPDGSPWTCPYGEPCTQHDAGNIIKAIKEY